MTYPPCRECGHSSGMHVKGSSPRYAGCMVRFIDDQPVNCRCRLTPAEAVTEAPEAIVGQTDDGGLVRLEPVR